MGKREGRNRGAPCSIHDRRKWNLGQSLWQHACLGHFAFTQYDLVCLYHLHSFLQTVATLRLWLCLYTKVYCYCSLSSIELSPLHIIILHRYHHQDVSHHSALDSTSSGPSIINSKTLNGSVASPSPRQLHGLLRSAYFIGRAQTRTLYRIRECMHSVSHHVTSQIFHEKEYLYTRRV